MLDDVLSAVDAHVACSILNNAILGPLMNQQTRILCTHNIQVSLAISLSHHFLFSCLSNTLHGINLKILLIINLFTK